MVLVDTSIWIDHLHRTVEPLVDLLDAAMVWMHPMVVGEIALGSLRERRKVLTLMADLPAAPQVSSDEFLHVVGSHRLHGRGLSLVDVHLLASARLMPGLSLWTRDRRLRTAAAEQGVAWSPRGTG